jgi:hypothetical protein
MPSFEYKCEKCATLREVDTQRAERWVLHCATCKDTTVHNRKYGFAAGRVEGAGGSPGRAS